MSWYKPSDIGFALRRQLADIGHGARLFARLLTTLIGSFKRFGLIRDQIHFLANNKAVTTGPSSRTKLSATSKPKASVEP